MDQKEAIYTLKEYIKFCNESNPDNITVVEQSIKVILDSLRYDSTRLIGDVQDHYKNLEHKGWDWRSFYNGWIEGRTKMLIDVKGLKND